MIVCADWRQVRGVLNTTLCDRVCDDWGRSGLCSIQPYVIQFVMTGDRSEVYSIQPCDTVCDEWGFSEAGQRGNPCNLN